MKTKVQKFNGYVINFKWSKNYGYIPMADDLLRAVGLPNTSNQLDKLYDLLNTHRFGKALRLISYLDDLTVKIAQKRLIDYLLLDSGCRITWGGKSKGSDFTFNRDLIIGLTDGVYHTNTNLEMIQKINELGFQIV